MKMKEVAGRRLLADSVPLPRAGALIAGVLLFAVLFTGAVLAGVGPVGTDAFASPATTQSQDRYVGSVQKSSDSQSSRPAAVDDNTVWPHGPTRGPSAISTVAPRASALGTGSISGTVTNAGGTPIDGIRIDVIDFETGEWLDYTFTDGTGYYYLDGLPNVSVYVCTYSVYPLNYIDEWFNNVPVPGNWEAEGAVEIDLATYPNRTDISFALTAGRMISGTVRNTSGVALADIEVDAYTTDGDWLGIAFTEATGVYHIVGLPAGVYYIATYNEENWVDEWYNDVVFAGNYDAVGATALDLTTATSATGKNFSLALGKYIAGRVMDSTGTGLSEVAVDAYNLSGDYVTSGYTEFDGSYAVNGLPPGQYRIRTDDFQFFYVNEWWCTGTTRLSVIEDPDGDGATTISVATTSASGKDFHLNAGRIVGGHVYDSGGEPLEGVEIDVYYSASSFETYSITDETGAWSVGGLFPGDYMIHTLNDQGYIDEWFDGQPFAGHLDGEGIEPVHLTSANASAQLYLDRGYSISGVAGWALYTPGVPSTGIADPMIVEIMDADGTPFAGSWVGGPDGDSEPDPYSTWALPPGTYYAKIVRLMPSGFAEQWYHNLPCSQYDRASATPIPVTNADVTDIDFPVQPLSYHEQDDLHILYSGTWSPYASTWASTGSYQRSNTSGSSVSISFTGISLDWVATMTGSAAGKADVYLDGVFQETVDLAAFSPAYQAFAWTTGDLPRGPHTVRIAWNPTNATGSKYITLDAVRIDGAIAYVPPSITSLSPNTGAIGGGTSVTINGVGFVGVTEVLFGETAAATIHVDSTTQITATAPAHEVGPVRVKVTASGGTTEDTPADDFTYMIAPTRYEQTDPHIVYSAGWATYPAPPTTGLASGGNYGRASTLGSSAMVYFKGQRLDWIAMKGTTTGKADVYLDGAKQTTVDLAAAAATYQVPVWSSPALDEEAVHKFEIRWAEGNVAGKYITLDAVDVVGHLVSAPPTITSISPSTGSTAGGTSVVINGTGFTEVAGVTFGGMGVRDYTVDSPTKITVVAPEHAVGSVRVDVTTEGGTTSGGAAHNYTYAEIVVPTVTALEPATGLGGTSVALTGTGFVGVTAVTFGGANATGFSVTDANHMTAVAPAHAAGAVNVVVTALGGTSSPDGDGNDFTYLTPPVLNRYEQSASGPYWAGTWTSVSSASYSGSSYRYTNTAGAAVTVAFNGTGLTWIGKKSVSQGQAYVSVDGGPAQTVDLYRSGTLYKTAIWSVSGLSDGLHTVKISRAGTKNLASTGYTINVDAFDIAGTLATLSKVQQTDARLVYAGTWATISATSASGGTYKRTNAAGASVTIPFNGQRLAVIATTGGVMGLADISVDGGDPETVNLHTDTALYQQTVWTSDVLPAGYHTVTVVPQAPGGGYVNIDAVEVVGSLAAATTFEQTNTKILWEGVWTLASSTSYSGGSHKYTDATGALATVNFTGVRISVVCRKAVNYGIAWIRIDGGEPIAVDLYNASTLYKQTVWTSPFLTPGDHTLTIECTGTKRTAATGVRVDLDAVKVIGTLK